MIPLDYITIDGNTAWLVVSSPVDAEITLDRTCDEQACTEGWWHDKDDDPLCVCELCDGTGRHTFEIEVERPVETLTDALRCDPITHRVHVVPGVVLPIVGRMADDPLHSKPHVCWDARHGHMLGMDYRQTPITLPPAARPGMWAVKLEVHQ